MKTTMTTLKLAAVTALMLAAVVACGKKSDAGDKPGRRLDGSPQCQGESAVPRYDLMHWSQRVQTSRLPTRMLVPLLP